MSAWRLVDGDTPRNGTEILAYRPDAGQFIAWFGSCELLGWTDAEIEAVDEDTFFFESWWTNTTSGACRLEGSEVPTRWMPLPEDPQ